jgi:hypothetical protein
MKTRASRLARFLVVCLSAAVATGAWAGDFAAGPLVQVSGTGPNPFAGCIADNVTGQPGINFPDSEVEPIVDVNPMDPFNIVGGWQQDRWSNGGARGLVAGVSLDGGVTWAQVVIPKITLCSDGTPGNGGDFKRATDPWVTFAPNGHVYFFSLSLDIETPPDRPGGFGRNAMFVSKSIDKGLTWSDPIKIAEDAHPRFLNDKNAITADPADANYVYAVWDRLKVPLGGVINPENVFGLGFKGPAQFSRTTDGGQTWEPPRAIYDPGGNNQTIGNQIVVLPDGTVVNFFNEILNFKNNDGGGHFEFNLSLIRSSDKGGRWTRGPAIRAAKMQSLALFRPFGVIDPDSDTDEGVRTEDVIPEVGVDRNPGSSAVGTLYAVWQDARFSGFSHDEIAFAQSRDGGFTWSTPIKINKTPANITAGNRQAFTPSIHVAADGTIGVTYYDFRNNTPAPATLETDYFIVHCHPITATTCTDPANWEDEVQLTDVSFDMRSAPLARGFFVGDYAGLASDGSDFAAFFSQSHATDPASVFFRRLEP